MADIEKLKIQRAYKESGRRMKREKAGAESKLRRSLNSRGQKELSSFLKGERAAKLYEQQGTLKRTKGENTLLSNETKRAEVKKHGKNMRRLEKVMPQNVKERVKTALKKAHKVAKLGSTTKMFKSPASPAGMIIGLGVESYKRDKSSKKINKLRKYKEGA